MRKQGKTTEERGRCKVVVLSKRRTKCIKAGKRRTKADTRYQQKQQEYDGAMAEAKATAIKETSPITDKAVELDEYRS